MYSVQMQRQSTTSKKHNSLFQSVGIIGVIEGGNAHIRRAFSRYEIKLEEMAVINISDAVLAPLLVNNFNH